MSRSYSVSAAKATGARPGRPTSSASGYACNRLEDQFFALHLDAVGGVRAPEGVAHDWPTLVQSVQDHVKSLNWGYRSTLQKAGVRYVNRREEWFKLPLDVEGVREARRDMRPRTCLWIVSVNVKYWSLG